MYKLTLTKPERMAIDWVGNRYSHGDDLRKILMSCETDAPILDEDDDYWNLDVDITFNIVENEAWKIFHMGEESNYLWDCFDDDLCQKLDTFCLGIV